MQPTVLPPYSIASCRFAYGKRFVAPDLIPDIVQQWIFEAEGFRMSIRDGMFHSINNRRFLQQSVRRSLGAYYLSECRQMLPAIDMWNVLDLSFEVRKLGMDISTVSYILLSELRDQPEIYPDTPFPLHKWEKLADCLLEDIQQYFPPPALVGSA